MRHPIRNQILLPFTAILIASVGVMATAEAWLAAGRAERELLRQLNSVMATIAQSSLNYTETVLLKMSGLSGADFVALNSKGDVEASTLGSVPLELKDLSAAPLIPMTTQLSDFPRLKVGAITYFAGRVKAQGSARVATLVVLSPESAWREARWSAAWPPLVVGGATFAVMFAVAAWIAARMARRVHVIEQLFADIARGEFRSIPLARSEDELDDLVLSANQLSEQLSRLQQTMNRTERMRLLAQLASGLAHQLRNAVTGARMAVQLHQRRCPTSQDDSLVVALRQLSMTEEYIKRLLSMSRQREALPVSGLLRDVCQEVLDLTTPVASHAHVALQWDAEKFDPQARIADAEGLKTSLLNVVLNAIEAAGASGDVRISYELTDKFHVLQVSDSGPGPMASIGDSLFEPFITTKPEGVGLGLSLAKQLIEDQSGSLRWFRTENRTVFEFAIPHALS